MEFDFQPTVSYQPIPMGERLRDWLRANGITQEEFAFEIEMEPAQLSRLLNGVYLPRVKRLRQICDATGLSADYLLGREEARDEGSGD
jgi:transcriptional regulator with XRE-family HTH domain